MKTLLVHLSDTVVWTYKWFRITNSDILGPKIMTFRQDVFFPALCQHTRQWGTGRWRWRSCWWGRLGRQCALPGWARRRGRVGILVVGSQAPPATYWRGRQLGNKCLYWSSWWGNSSKLNLTWRDRGQEIGPSGRLAARRQSWRSAWNTMYCCQ